MYQSCEVTTSVKTSMYIQMCSKNKCSSFGHTHQNILQWEISIIPPVCNAFIKAIMWVKLLLNFVFRVNTAESARERMHFPHSLYYIIVLHHIYVHNNYNTIYTVRVSIHMQCTLLLHVYI